MATNQQVVIQPRPNVKQINYLAKTFTDFRQNLIEFSKAYYPGTYADFNEASPGMMFIEMAAYLGDVLSFYIDNQFKENLLAYAEQPENIVTLSQFLGYKPKLTSVASATATLYQLAPATTENGVFIPDKKFLLQIAAGSTFSTNDQKSAQFRLMEDVDFSDTVDRQVIINSTTPSGNPNFYVVTKQAKLAAVTEKTTTFSFGSPQKFASVLLPNESIVGISSVVDFDGNPWYEVDYLAQDTITTTVDIVDNSEIGALPSAKLRLKKVPRRFVTRITRDLRTQLVFGSGTTNLAETDTTVDSRQIANSQYGSTIQNQLANTAINNVNFLNSSAYGVSPTNTTLTVSYLVGGGVASNTPTNTIVNIGNITLLNDTTAYTTADLNAFNAAYQSLSINNDQPATGGNDGETLSEIKENALAFFNAQNRVVTAEDYTVRAYALPATYGHIAKAYAIRDEQINNILTAQQGPGQRSYVDNPVRPNSINLYVLGYDNYGKLTTLNTLVKQNLSKYLEQYRLLTDDINILDAFVVNIGVNFSITVFKNYNVNDVLARAIGEIQNYFDTSKWTVNQPIIVSDLIYKVGSVDGVQNVKSLEIVNKYKFQDGSNYQDYRYSIDEATVNGIIYPSLDPCIFELKYPQSDIVGSAVQ
jgi:hypothetical protein